LEVGIIGHSFGRGKYVHYSEETSSQMKTNFGCIFFVSYSSNCYYFGADELTSMAHKGLGTT
jgi:hypothetical protein